MTVLSADTVVHVTGAWSPGWVRIDGAVIADCGPGLPPPDSRSTHIAGTIIPGFVDIHSHGAGGADFSAAAQSGIQPALDWHAAHGTTSVVASLATAPIALLEAQVIALDARVRDGRLRGIHLEGPWLSPGHRGAHDEALLRAPHRPDVERLLSLTDSVRMVTIAPELPGALDAIRAIVGAGRVAAIGHTSCDSATAIAAVDAGATVATHLFNGMPALHHREVGPVGVALLDERVFVELILDGHHLSAAAVEVALKLAGRRVMAVSDSIAATGCPDGDYGLAGSAIEVRDGVARTSVTGSLAGSTSTLDTAFHALVRHHSRSLAEAVFATSTAPAAAMGLTDVGRIEAGASADLVVLHDLRVRAVMKRGEWVTPPAEG